MVDVDATADIWSIVEVCIGIVSACLPTMRPLVRRLSQAIKVHGNAQEHIEDQETVWAPSGGKQIAEPPHTDMELGTFGTPRLETLHTQRLPSSPTPAKLAVLPFEHF